MADESDDEVTSIDRRWLAARRRRRQLLLALGCWAAAYLIAFGELIVVALPYALRFGDELSRSVSSQSVMNLLGPLIIVCATALFASGLIRVTSPQWPGLGQWPWVSGDLAVPTLIGALGVVILADYIGIARVGPIISALGLSNDWSYSYDGARPPTVLSALLDGAMFGIGIAVLALAIPATLLRFYRVRTAFALVILVGLRLVIWIDYGILGVLSLAPWALAAAAVYWRWPDPRLLVGLIAVDIFYWTIANLTYGTTVYLIVGIALTLVAFIANARWFHSPCIVRRSIRMRRLIGR